MYDVKKNCDSIYIFIAIALDESVILGFLHISRKTSRNHVTVSRAYGRSYVNVSQQRYMFTHVGVTSVVYRHDVKGENLAFWSVFVVKSDLMSNIRKISKIIWEIQD